MSNISRIPVSHELDFCHYRYFDNDPRYGGGPIATIVREGMMTERSRAECVAIKVYLLAANREANIE